MDVAGAKPQEAPAGLPTRRSGAARSVLVFFFFLLLTLLLHRETLSYSMLGHDSYPIIASARIESAGDLLGTFSEELMDGRYPKGHFYRPTLNLSFALDYALYGISPSGYHRTDLVLIAVAAFLLFRLVRLFPFGGSFLAGLLAGLFFLTHPSLLNVLPVPARRGDTLSLVFLLAALLSSGRGKTAVSLLVPALFTLLAVGSKETGALAIPLLFLLRLALPRTGRRRLLHALFATLPSAAVFLLFLAARQAVIGGIGGHRELALTPITRNTVTALVPFLRNTILPNTFDISFLWHPAGLAAAVLLLIAGALFTVRGGPRISLAVISLVWMVLSLVIHGLSGVLQPWYVFHMVVPFSLLFGLLGASAWASIGKARSIAGRIPPLLFAAFLLFLLAADTSRAPVFFDHPEWKEVTERTEAFLGELRERLQDIDQGVIEARSPLPFGARPSAHTTIYRAAGMADYSVQAWAELVFPEKRIRVSLPERNPSPPEEGEILLLVRFGF